LSGVRLAAPCSGSERGDALEGRVSKAGQDIGQVIAHRKLEPAATFDDRQNRRHTRAGLLAADVVSYHFICEWISHAICEWSQSAIKAGLLVSKLNAFAALGLFSNRSIWTGHGDAVHNRAAAPFQGGVPGGLIPAPFREHPLRG
jgi:hypothetical protein